MTPKIEKLLMTLLSAGLAVLAYFLADDQAVRGFLLTLAGIPAGGALLGRQEERDLEKVAKHSRPH